MMKYLHAKKDDEMDGNLIPTESDPGVKNCLLSKPGTRLQGIWRSTTEGGVGGGVSEVFCIPEKLFLFWSRK